MLFILCKSLLDYTNLFFPNDYEKNDQIINNEKDKNIYIYYVICSKCRKFEKPKISFRNNISYLLEETLFLSIIWSKCKNEDQKLFKDEESIEKFLVSLKIYNYFKNMVGENIKQEFRVKNIGETRNYFLEEKMQNELMSKKHKRVCMTLNYIEQFLILASTITGCISISAFASLFGIPIGITKSVIGLKIYAIVSGIKKYKSLIKKKKRTKIK